MKRRAPGSLTTIGTLNIVFGSLFSFCCLSLTVLQATDFGMFGDNLAQVLLEDFLERELPLYQVMKWGSAIVGLGCFIVMLISGIGLVSQSAWARVMAVANAWVMIAYFIISGVYDIFIQAPAANRFLRANPMPGDASGFMWMQVAFQAVIYVLLLVYAMITLVLLMSSRVKDFFHETPFDDFYEEDWDDAAPGRRRRRDWDEY